jgi:TIR domain
MTAPLKVFLSYAHADEAHRKTLVTHLSALEDEGLIAVWHGRKVTGGRAWAGAIDEALRSADIVLLLISADFLASDYWGFAQDPEHIPSPSLCQLFFYRICLFQD